jgi:hypothetical protein
MLKPSFRVPTFNRSLVFGATSAIGIATLVSLSTSASGATWRTYGGRDDKFTMMYDADSLYVDRNTGFVIVHEISVLGLDTSNPWLNGLLAIDCEGKRKRQIGIYDHSKNAFRNVKNWATRKDGMYVRPIPASGGDSVVQAYRRLADEVCFEKPRLPVDEVPSTSEFRRRSLMQRLFLIDSDKKGLGRRRRTP